MLADSANTNISIGTFSGPQPGSALKKLISFIKSELPNFSKWMKKNRASIKNEKGITDQLCIRLSKAVREKNLPYFFVKDSMEDLSDGNSPAADIGVHNYRRPLTIEAITYSSHEPFFLIEAKRLSNKLKAREKEYLVGRYEKQGPEKKLVYVDAGGIERFKKKIHGRNHNFAALIGYVQSENFNSWFQKINGWIEEFVEAPSQGSAIWQSTEKLFAYQEEKTTAVCESVHHRDSCANIHLTHLWIYVNL